MIDSRFTYVNTKDIGKIKSPLDNLNKGGDEGKNKLVEFVKDKLWLKNIRNATIITPIRRHNRNKAIMGKETEIVIKSKNKIKKGVNMMGKVRIVFLCLFVSLIFYGCNPNWFGSSYNYKFGNRLLAPNFKSALEPLVELRLNLETDQYDYNTGDNFFASGRIKNITNKTVSRDFYIGAILPDQFTIAFVNEQNQVQMGTRDNISTWKPHISNLTLQAGSKLDFALQYQWEGIEPDGDYKAIAFTTIPGAFADGEWNVDDVRDGSFWNFSFLDF